MSESGLSSSSEMCSSRFVRVSRCNKAIVIKIGGGQVVHGRLRGAQPRPEEGARTTVNLYIFVTRGSY